MALKQYIGTNNSTLVKKLATVLAEEKELFTPTFICISHSSTKDWLIEELVKEIPVVGNCVFQKQHELIDMIHTSLNGNASKKELYHSDHLQWFIFSILRSDTFRSKFTEISAYYGDDSFMQYTLSEKVTELFSSYQETATALIDSFDSDLEGSLHFEWQKYIWKELQVLTENKFASLSIVYKAIDEILKNEENQKLLQSKFPNIHIYGDLQYTSELIQFLSTIAKYTNVSIFRVHFLNHSNASRFVKNNSRFSEKNNLLINQITTDFLADNSSVIRDTLLERLKAEIENPEQDISFNYKKNDNSITIANCFTEYREVEALWHYLVCEFNRNTELALRDICVIVPNIEKYAPAIKAVFKNEKVSLNYSFYDSSSKIQDSPYKALLALYNFDSEGFTSKQVFSLLEFKYIREKFGISEDLSIIKKAIDDASIFHGYDGDEKFETQYISWKQGLKRLIIGACIEKTEEEITGIGEDFYPISEFEDQSMYELIKLNQFVESLYSFSEERKEARSLGEWQSSIKKVVNDFLNVSDYEPSNFDRKLEQLVRSNDVIPNERIDFNVIRYYLIKLFENQDLSNRIGFGGIRFVSPNPMMVTSFKINCFLGLNGNDFPRTFKKLSFDLRNEEQITTSNDLDKHLFLLLIQGAKEKLYLSYIGQSSKDNSVIPTSTLVEDLVAVCKKWNVADKELIVKHPLHAFSTKYNNSKQFPKLKRFDIYSDNDRNSGLIVDPNTKKGEVLRRDKNGRIIIPLHELIRFTEDPVKYYYTKVLGIYYSDNSIDLAESELFDLDHLKKWNVKNAILQGELNQAFDEEKFYEKLKINGQFPFLNLGEIVQGSISKEAHAVIESIREKVDLNTREIIPIYIKLNDHYIIEGSIDTIFDGQFLFATVSSDKWKYQLRSVIQFLAVIISSNKRITSGYYFSKNNINELGLTYEEAITNLVKLCANYEEGTTNLKHFSIDFGDKLNVVFKEENTNESFVKNIKGIINHKNSYVNPSEYFMRELNNGSITNNEAKETFKNYYTFIRELLTSTLSKL